MYEFVRDTDQFIVAWAPLSDVDGTLLSVVIGSARTIDQPNLYAVFAYFFDVFQKSWALLSCFDKLFSKLSSEIFHGSVLLILIP